MQFVDPAVIHAAAKRGEHVYPYAEYRPLPEATTQPEIRPWSFMFHTMAGPRTTTPDALWKYANRTDIGGEPHLMLGYSTLIQAMPFNVRADNNARANRWQAGGEWRGAVSVETQDDGSTVDPAIAKTPWNAYQVEHLAGIAAFLNLRYGIPIQRCATWDGPGMDGHRKFPEWSIYVGKTCPGETRWNQIPAVLELAREIAAWTAPKPPPPPPPPPTTEVPDVFTYTPAGYANAFLIGAGPATHLDGPSFTLLNGTLKVPHVAATVAHPQMLRSILHQSGLTEADLVKL